MGTSLSVIESGMDRDIMPRAANMLAVVPDVAPVAFKAAFMESLARNPRIGETCTLQSIFMSATTLAAFGVLPGPFLGQGWLIPRKNKGVWQCNAQLGYKGLNTIAGRGGRTIEADVIRKADRYEIRKGTSPVINVWPNLDEPFSSIIAAYSMQEFQGRRVSPMVLPVADLLAIKDKNSKAANKDDDEGSGFSPWNDPKIGFPAMCQKTAALRQRRTMPMGLFHYAGAMDDLQEQGQAAWVIPREDGGISIMTGDNQEIRQPTTPAPNQGDDDLTEHLERPEFIMFTGPGKKKEFSNVDDWKGAFMRMINSTPPRFISAVRTAHGEIMAKLSTAGYSNEALEVAKAMEEREKKEQQ